MVFSFEVIFLRLP